MKRHDTLLAAMLGAVACTFVATPANAQDGTIALTGARILPVGGTPIDDGVLLISGGKIQYVGDAAGAALGGATVVDCAGKIITPGFVDAGTTVGLSSRDQNEQGDEVTPQVHVLDAIDPEDKRFDRARRHGVTTLQVGVGNRNVIGGLGAVLKNRDVTSVRKMLLLEESGLRLTLGAEPSRGNRGIRGSAPTTVFARRPSTRMGVVWEARKAFYDALDYREERSIDEGDPGPADPGMEVLLRALNKDVTVHTTARAEHDIRTALRLAEEFGYETLIEGSTEAWRVVDELAAAGVRVLMSAPSSTTSGQRADQAEQRFHTLNVLAKAGIPFAIQTGPDATDKELVHEAMMAVRNGLSHDAALAAITLVPAQILGIDDRVGSIATGLDADFVIWTGSPFDPTTRIAAVYIDGEEVQ